ncbi:MAG TPA: hypothetical protein VGD10_05995 [Allosphingosinicella sp.]
MLNVGKLGQAAVSVLGAIILTTTVVGAAVGPARVAETTPVQAEARA